jgi:5'-nucleotidase
MAIDIRGKLIVAISSRALFDLEASNAVYEAEGVEAYCRYQIEHEDDVLAPGVAYPLVRKLLALDRDGAAHPGVEVILLSRNSADTGLRVFNSIQHYALAIQRAAFTGGGAPFGYAAAFEAGLFLSAHVDDVRGALEAGIPAATILPSAAAANDDGQLRIAFDGDAVLFSDEAEQIYRSGGLDAFEQSERDAASVPLSGGPFRHFLAALCEIQKAYPAEEAPIRTALVTARGAPTHERVIRTLRAWGIRIDEALFLGGLDKGAFLETFAADIYFDDQQGHCDSTRRHVATGHVPHGVANRPPGEGTA